MYPSGGGTTREQTRRPALMLLFTIDVRQCTLGIFFIFLSTKPTKYDYLLFASPSHRDRWYTNGIDGPD